MSPDNLCQLVNNKLSTGVLILDIDYNIVLQNDFLQIHSGKLTKDIVGKNIFTVYPELPQPWLNRKLSAVLMLKSQSFCSWEQRHHLFELPHTRPISTDSKFMAQNCNFLPLFNGDEVEYICILIEDATDVCYYQSVLNRTLNELALANRIDGLTQIYNRKHWEECLDKEFSRSKRHGHELSLIMLDLDKFKILNDTYGHQCGDVVLQEATQKIKSFLRLSDFFGRYGGEEFSIILPETDIKGAQDVAERIRVGIEQHIITYQTISISISISVGVAKVEGNDIRYEDLIGKADEAMYQAKKSGRNRVCVSY